MAKQLNIQFAQATNAGRKPSNQDFLAYRIPSIREQHSKGIACAIADGISTSKVSHIASQSAVEAFLEDYYSTPDAWSVKHCALKVLQAHNAWLYAQSQQSPNRFEKDKGYICTFSGIIFKAQTAHIFHAGDSRIYRFNQHGFEQLTQDHCRIVDEETQYLTRALGIHNQLDLDYRQVRIQQGDVFLLTSDGIHDWLSEEFIAQQLSQEQSLERHAGTLIQAALAAGSNDNLSIQLAKVSELGDAQIQQLPHQLEQQIAHLPLPPRLEARMLFDGFRIERELYISSRSHVFLATDLANNNSLVIKTPSTELAKNATYLENLLQEEWIARRLNNNHILRAYQAKRDKNYLYLSFEYIQGQSLQQWLLDNPNPSLNQVRDIIGQIAKGLMAFHRQEMLHQDLRPANILIDQAGTVKIIDFGSTRVAGIHEMRAQHTQHAIAGTVQYAAPEYFIGQVPDQRSDVFSLAVITYQMLSQNHHALPYGNKLSQCQHPSDFKRLHYQALRQQSASSSVPDWLDHTLQKALKLKPHQRYQDVAEFLYDLNHAQSQSSASQQPSLIERNPVLFWQSTSAILLLVVLCLIQLLLES